ncbi:hypothetical protein MJO28_002423 [Puccinia striiformis f. sp. tritici]|uniref:Uncharacterized protein n=3 Tax=Puccinia striiformis TaxID=27350 RepID=A0A0L0VLP9_9BASI|nr:hypothetical protein Pst134EA_005613 [Puccinia striiformis f. sp. tritici]KNF00213.1 hypothetical protein PSTG_06627 [Puccinia striiformis f. sp. tritici PST-78]POW01581.1 hypothetical protein PSTT_12372 [Puccinia striiformis]KAH9462800.1 hypothetical protein Pst134EB_006677 [Puccinia striiformis f. sp. tritici]KAH9471732.1 hypothetical protein Pst134EA_005613 [Puccinia striiformis f. sp. tritici]KAI7958632.1 hypothetical protein MJO28_002423 [Puccinia striiformis f. sp. tritici]
MLYRPQSSPFLLSILVSLLTATTRAIPINVSGTVNHVAPIDTSTHLPLLEDCHSSLIRRAVGGIPLSGASVGPSGRLDVVRRAVGTVADSACGPVAAIHTVSNLKRRSVAHDASQIFPIFPNAPVVGPIVDEVQVADELHVANILPVLVKRSQRPPVVKPAPKPAPKKVVAPPNPPPRAPGTPDNEKKWGGRQRAW